MLNINVIIDLIKALTPILEQKDRLGDFQPVALVAAEKITELISLIDTKDSK